MSTRKKNTSSTALLLPDWYVDFQAALLKQAPRPGEIDQITAERWTSNPDSLKNKLNACLVPPTAKVVAKILKNNSQFLTNIFTGWYNGADAEKAHQSIEIISPKDIDWEAKKDDQDESKFGEYTINPETISINWENIPLEKIKVFDFAEFVGQPRWKLAKHLVENYSDKYHIPGIEYWKYLIENKNKIPEELKDGNYYYFFGSILRVQDGNWFVLDSGWDDSQWERDAFWLGFDWNPEDRVLLLKK